MNTLNISDIILLGNYFNAHTIENLNKIIESYNVGTMTPDKAWEKYKINLNERFEKDDSAPKHASSLPQEFIEADPTIEKTYLNWIILSYLRGGIKKFEDIASTGPALKKYKFLKGKHLKLTSIDKFCGIVECTTVIEKINIHGDTVINKQQIPGLEDYLGRFKDELKDFEIEYKEETKEYEKLVENDEVLIVHPLTERASRRYGKNTKWCVSADNDNMFEEYNKDGPLYMFIPKKEQHTSEKYAIHIFTGNFVDEEDNPVELGWLFQTRFSDLLKAKDKTSKEYKFIKKLWEESKAKDFNLLFVPEDEQTRGMILKAIKQNGYSSEELRNKDIVLATIKRDGRALKYTSEKFKNNKEIVLAAVKKDGRALEYASEKLQNNKKIVLAAVKQNGFALQFASEKLKNDKEILAVVK